MISPAKTSERIFQQMPILCQGNMRKNDSWQTIANQSEGPRPGLLCGALRLIFDESEKKMGTVFGHMPFESILFDTVPYKLNSNRSQLAPPGNLVGLAESPSDSDVGGTGAAA
jgi:hypothetical protein